MVSYLKDYRFSSILVKYFMLLLICLVLPMVALSIWYGNQMKKNIEEEIIKRNEASLQQAHDNVNSIIHSVKNLAYSLSVSNEVRYLSVKDSLNTDSTEDIYNLNSMLTTIKNANDYIDSMCVYFQKSNAMNSQDKLQHS